MLKQLRVGNLALVEDLAISLDSGLTMLTGETGAGKSLVAGALGLLTGAKAEKDMIRLGQETAYVEAVFDLAGKKELDRRCRDLGVLPGEDGILVLRRELRREGRGRVLINGLISSLALLEQVGSLLLAIQSQDVVRQLSRSSFAIDFLDAVLGLKQARASMVQAKSRFEESRERHSRRLNEEEFARQQLEIWQYQFRELEEAALDVQEEVDLSERLAFGRNARALMEAAGAAREILTESQVNARGLLGAAETHLSPLESVSPRLAEILALIREASASAAEAGSGLERLLDHLDTDPVQLDEMEARQSLFSELKRKYGRGVEDLLELQEDLRTRIERQEVATRDLEELASGMETARLEMEATALALRDARKAGLADVARKARELIRPLALPDLDLEFRLEPDLHPDGLVQLEGHPCRATSRGADRVRLMARTNRGESFGEVGTIASGGERSRIFLGLTVLAGRQADPPVMLFDEIDAGLGMDNAIPVAELLARLAERGQVLCITHLATVAARGRHHLKVSKAAAGDRTVLVLESLADESRLREVARLLGGPDSGASQEVLSSQEAYARQLLGHAI